MIEIEEEDEEEWSDEDAEEGLERKLARLRREVQEVQADFERRRRTEGEQNGQPGEKDKDTGTGIAELSKALDTLRVSQRDAVSAHAYLARQLAEPPMPSRQITAPAENSAPVSQSPNFDPRDAQTLAQVADFDTRLSSLERALGLDSHDLASATSTPIAPILPTLSLLDKQVALLTSSETLPHLEALTQTLQSASQASAAKATSTTTEEAAATRGTTLTPEDITKLHSLYALLPTLSSLSPTLSPLLARLRSLRTLHASAAGAAQTLEDVERRQVEMEKDIQDWRAGLEKVEGAIKGAEKGMRDNTGVVEGWVKELEGRIKGLQM